MIVDELGCASTVTTVAMIYGAQQWLAQRRCAPRSTFERTVTGKVK